MATRILLRRDLSSNWANNNPILLAGEIGVETDTLKFKIGNGSRWNDINSYAFKPGAAGGLAELDVSGKISIDDLPSEILLASEGAVLVQEAINNITTSDIEEGSNLYFTTERAISSNSTAIADSLQEAKDYTDTKSSLAESNAINASSENTDTAITNAVLSLTTDTISEGSNLYFTDARARSAIGTLTTSSVSEGSRLYFTNARAVAANTVGFQQANATAAGLVNDLRDEIASSYVTTSSLNNTLDANGYIIDADRNQAYGFAGLDSNTKILDSVIPSTIARIASPTFTGDAKVENLEVTGDLVFSGTATLVNSENVTVSDSIIYLADQQFTSDVLDIGIYGAYGSSGDSDSSHPHTGLIRDHADGKWKLFSNGSEPSDNTIDFTGVTYDTIKVGAIEADSATIGDVNSTEISYLSGVTSAIQTQINTVSGSVTSLETTINTSLNLKAPLNSPSFTGLVDFSEATVSGIDTIPPQSGNNGKYLTTDGTSATWSTIDLSDYLTTTVAEETYQKKVSYGTSLTPPSGASAGDIYIQY